METQTPTRRQLETALVEKCWKDPEFKKEMVSDPKGMFERHTGRKLPEQVKIFIHEEDANTLHLSIPPAPSNLRQLSDEDLERVAGGTDIAMTVMSLITGVSVVLSAGGVATGIGAAVTHKQGW